MTEWTKEQKDAISMPTNLLVNAAAGSGKTAVLVERVTNLMLPDENGCYIDADRILVVTFARDAAHEMQSRIKSSLTKLLKEEHSEKQREIIKHQLKLLPFADITTIDAFCMKLVKNNFHLLGIDPKFTIMDTDEAVIFAKECINEYFDKMYEEENPDFLLLTKLYSSSYNDRSLQEVIYRIYSFTRSIANPNEWLKKHTEDYKKFSGGFAQTKQLSILHSSAKEALKLMKSTLDDFVKEVASSPEPNPELFGKKNLYAVLNRDIAILKTLTDSSWDEALNTTDFEKITAQGLNSKSNGTDEIEKHYINQRNAFITDVSSVASSITEPEYKLDEYYRERLYPHSLALANIVCGFSDYYFNKKSKSARFEFNDLEHMSIKLITDFEGIKNNLTDRYKEILMDEYQDTNDLQETLFSMISTGKNRFIVGDLKQSIYRFRQSEPEIFKKKDRAYSREGSDGNRIILSKNFRSREEVLESINYLFRHIMTDDIGGVNYDLTQELNYGNHFFDSKAGNTSYASEMYLIEAPQDNDDGESYATLQAEAETVASKIKEMIDNKFPVIQKDGTFRPIKAEDFAILLRSVKTSAEVFVSALSDCGITSTADDGSFFQRTEIKLISEFIKAVNNPLRDMPLVSIMRSPVYRFSDDELGKIRLCSDNSFWDAVKKACLKGDALSEKCSEFTNDINSFRKMSQFMTADKLIWKMLTKTSLYDMCGILYGGELAQANLRLYMEKARILSENGIATLFDFEEYIDRISQTENAPCAKLESGGVTVMTIHKSKGLEFPVVFLCGLGKRFSSMDKLSSVYLNKEYGLGINGVFPEQSYSIPSPNKKVISSVMDSESKSESLRLLYVAMTRAKEKLILTATVKEPNKYRNIEINQKYIKSCTNYIDIIAPVVLNCKEDNLWKCVTTVGIKTEAVNTPPEQMSDSETLKQSVFSILESLENINTPTPVRTKVSVSSLKNSDDYSTKLVHLPELLSEFETLGAKFGTNMHSIMEQIIIKPDMDISYINDEILRITGENNDKLSLKVFKFFSAELGKRCIKNGMQRERHFETEIPALDDFGVEINGETMLLQGIIDCCFEENGKIVLIDYKTDTCSDIKELEEKYQTQLKWYKYAIEKITNKIVSEVYIYSFHKDDSLRLFK